MRRSEREREKKMAVEGSSSNPSSLALLRSFGRSIVSEKIFSEDRSRKEAFRSTSYSSSCLDLELICLVYGK